LLLSSLPNLHTLPQMQGWKVFRMRGKTGREQKKKKKGEEQIRKNMFSLHTLFSLKYHKKGKQ